MWAHECPWYSCNGLNQCSICSGPLSNLLQCQAAAGERCLPQCPFSLPVTPPQQSCSPGWSGKANSIRKVPTLDHGGSKTSSNKPSRGLHHAYHTFFIFSSMYMYCVVLFLCSSRNCPQSVHGQMPRYVKMLVHELFGLELSIFLKHVFGTKKQWQTSANISTKKSARNQSKSYRITPCHTSLINTLTSPRHSRGSATL